MTRPRCQVRMKRLTIVCSTCFVCLFLLTILHKTESHTLLLLQAKLIAHFRCSCVLVQEAGRQSSRQMLHSQLTALAAKILSQETDIKIEKYSENIQKVVKKKKIFLTKNNDKKICSQLCPYHQLMLQLQNPLIFTVILCTFLLTSLYGLWTFQLFPPSSI